MPRGLHDSDDGVPGGRAAGHSDGVLGARSVSRAAVWAGRDQ
jgi:hypothetical protein